MPATARFIHPDDFELEITLSMKVSEWKQLSAALSPGQLKTTIENATRRAEKLVDLSVPE